MSVHTDALGDDLPGDDLLALEKGFWTGGPDFYRAHVDDECLLAFTDMAGVHVKEEIAETAKAGRWLNVQLAEKGTMPLGEDGVILTYEVTSTRADGAAYHALVSTGYVRRSGAWKMCFHQQTPITDKS
jgi:hypothetical protein